MWILLRSIWLLLLTRRNALLILISVSVANGFAAVRQPMQYSPRLALLHKQSHHVPARNFYSFTCNKRDKIHRNRNSGILHATSIQGVQSKLVPSIPLQEIQKPNQFQPRFIVKEFLYGVKYMCRMHWLLLAGSVVARLILFKCLNPIALEWILQRIGPRKSVNLYLYAESFFKNAFAELTGYNPNRPMPEKIFYLGLVVPVCEEMSHRGLGQALKRIACRFDLYFFAILSSWSVKLGLASKILAWLVELAGTVVLAASRLRNNKAGGSTSFLSLSLISRLSKWVGYGLMFPAIWEIYKMVRPLSRSERNAINWWDTIRHLDTSLVPPVRQPRQEESGTSLSGSEDTMKKSTQQPQEDPVIANPAIENVEDPNLEAENIRNDNVVTTNMIIRRSISRSVRWYGSCSFGAAHYAFSLNASSSSPFHMLVRAQKCLGTLVSSLLIESRLAINRRTLWGSFGAHAAFNILGTGYSVHPICFLTLPQGGLLRYSWYSILFGSGLLLLIHKVYLDCIIAAIDWIEGKLF